MQISPLQLEDYLLRELQFSMLAPLDEIPKRWNGFDLLDIDVKADVTVRNAAKRQYRCELSVFSKPDASKKYPYHFRIVYVGFFKVADGFPDARLEQMVRANAPALLYSAARETLMFITGRGRFPAVLLPSITFIQPPTDAPAIASSKALRAQAIRRRRSVRETSKKK